jgi:small conductance mechanosensitive channel
MTTEDARCFIVDEASNVVVYSSDPALVGAKILERGLTEKSLRDGYMDFGTVDDDDNFILTARDESSIFYYTIKCRALLRSVLKYGLFAAVLYLIGVVVLLLILFRGYTQEAYEGIATVKDPDDGISSRRYEDLEAEDDDEGSETVRTLKIHLRQTAGKRLEDKARNSKLKDTLQKLRKKVKWDEQGPEGKAAIVFRAGLTLLLIGWGDLIVRSNLTSKGYGTMANFLLHGDWVKGVNLFSVCSVILIISLAYLVNVISALVLKLLSTFLLGKGQTLCKLIHNAIKYLSVFVSVYFMLQYFGFPIGTVIGSIGIVSLALSLGARDMAADVLAGLSIVFEKSFEVGDIVQIGNAKGVVQEIGVRSTKLLTMDNNLMTIINHSIDTIVNNTRKFS